jgi:hypothetical protein
MSKKRPPYPPEFRRQLIELVRAGPLPEDLALRHPATLRTDKGIILVAQNTALINIFVLLTAVQASFRLRFSRMLNLRSSFINSDLVRFSR